MKLNKTPSSPALVLASAAFCATTLCSISCRTPGIADLIPSSAHKEEPDDRGSFLGSAGTALAVGGLTAFVLDETGHKNSEGIGIAVAAVTLGAMELVRGELDRRRAAHESEAAYLDAQIADAQADISTQKSELQHNEIELERQRTTVASLERQTERNQEFEKAAATALTEVRGVIAQLSLQKEETQKEISIYAEAVKSSQEILDASVPEEELLRRRSELEEKRKQRFAQLQLLTTRIDEAVALESRVVALN